MAKERVESGVIMVQTASVAIDKPGRPGEGNETGLGQCRLGGLTRSGGVAGVVGERGGRGSEGGGEGWWEEDVRFRSLAPGLVWWSWRRGRNGCGRAGQGEKSQGFQHHPRAALENAHQASKIAAAITQADGFGSAADGPVLSQRRALARAPCEWPH
jgi:hypothetical protein